ncbi:hypothetical protein CC79DRAFT_1337436 [Sarocladium strictum]
MQATYTKTFRTNILAHPCPEIQSPRAIRAAGMISTRAFTMSKGQNIMNNAGCVMQRYEAVETFPLILVLLLRRLFQAVGIPTRWYRLSPRIFHITLRSKFRISCYHHGSFTSISCNALRMSLSDCESTASVEAILKSFAVIGTIPCSKAGQGNAAAAPNVACFCHTEQSWSQYRPQLLEPTHCYIAGQTVRNNDILMHSSCTDTIYIPALESPTLNMLFPAFSLSPPRLSLASLSSSPMPSEASVEAQQAITKSHTNQPLPATVNIYHFRRIPHITSSWFGTIPSEKLPTQYTA